MTLDEAVALSFLHGLTPDEWHAALRGQHPEARERARLHLPEAASALEAAARRGVHPVAFGDPVYPAALTTIPDPPAVLWVRGHPRVLDRPTVAVVGSRAASAYALDVAAQLGADLAARGIVVASGLARGVDSAAHRGALDAEGLTVAVLGSGVDRVYPPEHRPLAEQIAQAGAVVSELVPGTSPLPFHFPRRNRIISGLSLAVVVVEAHEQSGSLITARCALEHGREVMAVPGNVLSGRNRGSHSLLKDGAKIVESVDDILSELPLVVAAGSEPGGGPGPTATDDPVLGRMEPGEPYDLEALTALTGLDSSRLLPRLLALELTGSVRRAGGGRFVRSPGNVLT